ncbi:glycosyltransferase family 2 protein [Streptococcus pneumoniae]|uniref:glycosyltransferase family 2 protein n=1 Tax=Streptococcus pneumoniae TaxID=1313 RepID=UPI0005DF0132|nr:glycosyltransferase family 2 protein [Streptococcus pneumoniae]MDG9057306.1 glycosyltransferase [Streptococcus pneumoniae]MDV8202674.1 glycosyltransferase [Streptococcus pneumoniae]CEV66457.1 glycosyl transferase family protein [Streptococcus pneumoniae]CEX37046.1 glycosyl transferase family protein [Streptococcus pneumoniae]CEX88053.1 glycosyl transferase family protein [Streptococcus pneumoniae]
MGHELISIIVPIYNVENYLRQCLDSIQNQTYQNFECLLINDGSPDNSADICREYVSKDSRFRYFEKENGGVSLARNLGIELSEGDYITFIDSDDWVDSDYLEVLYSAILEEQADIAVSTYKKFNTSDNCWYFHSFQVKYDRKVFTNIELIDELVDLDSFDFSYRFVSGKLVNKTSLKKIRFNELTTLGEDMEFWFKLYLISARIVYVNRDSYIYRVSDYSRHVSLEKFRSDLQQYLNFLTFLSIKGFDISRYKDRCISLIQGRDQIVKELADYDTDENIRWFNEMLFLLEGENS